MAIFFILGVFLIIMAVAVALIINGWVWTGIIVLVVMILLFFAAAWDATP